MENLLQLRLTIVEIARQLKVDRSVVYKAMSEYGLYRENFSQLSQDEIEKEVDAIKQNHPKAGEVMVQGYLESRGLYIQRQKVRKAIHMVDPLGVEERKSKPIKRRIYTNPFPNYIWHIDGNHKLVRWRLVIHHGIDGFSRLVVFAHCSSNNRATTVLYHFLCAVSKYGRPYRIRTDLGGENVDIWHNMILTRGNETKPVVVGNSVHNQRIERHNRALNEQVLTSFRSEFYALESEGVLNVNNDTDIFCLHSVYLPRINKILDEFVAAHNSHKISTEGNKTPEQLFWVNIRNAYHEDDMLPNTSNLDIEELASSDLPHVNVPDISCPLQGDLQLQNFSTFIQSLSAVSGKAAYLEAVRFLGQSMLDEQNPEDLHAQ